MAGGMHPGRSGRSLAERAEQSRAARPAQSGGAAESRRAPAPGRHCWVHDPPGAPGVWPGLLVEWRQADGGWQGRVAYAVPGPLLVEGWIPAARLEQR